MDGLGPEKLIIKYTNQKYVEAMLNEGKVRLSTFWDFQVHERAEVRDPDEGQSGFIFRNTQSAPWVITAEQLNLASMGVTERPRWKEPKTLMPGDEGWIEGAGGFNTFMYSSTTADAPSTQLMDKFGYDAAVEIVDIESFARFTGEVLQRHLSSELELDKYDCTATRCLMRSVDYVESKRRLVTPSTVEVLPGQNSLTDARELFTKIKRFEPESEFRIAYFFMNPTTEQALQLDTGFPKLRPVIVGDRGTPWIAKTLRRIDPSEFVA